MDKVVVQDRSVGPILDFKEENDYRLTWAEILDKGLTFKALWAQ